MERRKERIERGIKVRAGDVFALCSWREMLYLLAPRLIPVLGFLLLPLVLDNYWQKVLLSVAAFALLAISWDILAQAGMISLGQALFFGLGAYCSGVLTHALGWPPLLALPAAALLGLFWPAVRDPGNLHLAGRLLAVLFDLGTVCLAYGLGRRLAAGNGQRAAFLLLQTEGDPGVSLVFLDLETGKEVKRVSVTDFLRSQ